MIISHKKRGRGSHQFLHLPKELAFTHKRRRKGGKEGTGPSLWEGEGLETPQGGKSGPTVVEEEPIFVREYQGEGKKGTKKGKKVGEGTSPSSERGKSFSSLPRQEKEKPRLHKGGATERK